MNQTRVNLWLYICCGMIFVMALIGAITRLTESGLSIADWAPITGALPPLSTEAWNKAFDAYKTIPQYQIFNRGMSLDDFKGIFYWEWFHRLWGRIIGLIFALPLIFFYATRAITTRFFLKLLAIFALGGLQGFIGWFMVQSGLEARTSVSPYRLALHLIFALLLFALLLWTALGNKEKTAVEMPGRLLLPQGFITLGFVAITIFWGALVAGHHAGMIYNTWPLMDGGFVPPDAWSARPAWSNIFQNPAMVQFTHRWLAITTFVLILSWVAAQWRTAAARKPWLGALAGMALLQVALGITTLLSHVQIVAAVAHQAGAMCVLTLLIVNLRSLYDSRTTGK